MCNKICIIRALNSEIYATKGFGVNVIKRGQASERSVQASAGSKVDQADHSAGLRNDKAGKGDSPQQRLSQIRVNI